MKHVLEQAYDLHVHAGPSTMKRAYDALDAIRIADGAQMKGLLFLDHSTPTTGLATILNRLDYTTKAFGAIMLNQAVGGLNPAAVEAALQMGVRMVQMPTYSAASHLQKYGVDKRLFAHLESETEGGIRVLDESGALVTAAMEILSLVAEYGCMVATGHLGAEETRALVAAACAMGIERVMVTSVSTDIVDLPVGLQLELRGMGAFLEHNYLALTELPHRPLTVDAMAAQIKAVGADRCVLATDVGQVNGPDLVTAFLDFLGRLGQAGITESEIDFMIRKSPAFLLDDL